MPLVLLQTGESLRCNRLSGLLGGVLSQNFVLCFSPIEVLNRCAESFEDVGKSMTKRAKCLNNYLSAFTSKMPTRARVFSTGLKSSLQHDCPGRLPGLFKLWCYDCGVPSHLEDFLEIYLPAVGRPQAADDGIPDHLLAHVLQSVPICCDGNSKMFIDSLRGRTVLCDLLWCVSHSPFCNPESV